MMKTAAWAGPSAPKADVAQLPALLEVDLVYVDLGQTYRVPLAEAMVLFAYSYRNGWRTTIRTPQGLALAAHDGVDIDADPPLDALLVRMTEVVDALFQARLQGPGAQQQTEQPQQTPVQELPQDGVRA